MAERDAKGDVSRLEKALSELNKCDSNSIEYLPKFLKYFELFKKVFPGLNRGYNLGSPFARPDPTIPKEVFPKIIPKEYDLGSPWARPDREFCVRDPVGPIKLRHSKE